MYEYYISMYFNNNLPFDSLLECYFRFKRFNPEEKRWKGCHFLYCKLSDQISAPSLQLPGPTVLITNVHQFPGTLR